MASDILFYGYSCPFQDFTFYLIFDHDHNHAKTSENTFTNRKYYKERTSSFSPCPSPSVASKDKIKFTSI